MTDTRRSRLVNESLEQIHRKPKLLHLFRFMEAVSSISIGFQHTTTMWIKAEYLEKRNSYLINELQHKVTTNKK